MDVTLFDVKSYDKKSFALKNHYGYNLIFHEASLNKDTAKLAAGSTAVVPFVNDDLSYPVLKELKDAGVELIALRSAGFNNVDLKSAEAIGIKVARVPQYSPHAIAEEAIALLLTLVRKLQHSYVRSREFNFSLEGLVGFDLYGKTVGVIGTGRIGRAFIDIAKGLGMHVLCYDPYPSQIDGAEYSDLDVLYRRSDIISLHCPLTEQNIHMIDENAISKMKNGVYIINTSRGALIKSEDLLNALKSHKVGAAGLDVYEEEAGLFFSDNSVNGISDDILARLISMPNVLVTGHQAYLTEEALESIAEVTLSNIRSFENGHLKNEVSSNQ